MLLVLDTCFHACSVALYDEDEARVVASRFEAMERGHAEALGPMVEQMLCVAAVRPDQLSRIAVTCGPGTFTGLRIGLSFAKGMALGLNIPLIGIDSLTATAAPHFGGIGTVAVALQAGRTGLFYGAMFDSATGAALIAPHLARRDDILKQAHDLLAATGPQAEHFAAYAASLPVTDKNIEPLYLREPDAKPSVSNAASQAHVRVASESDRSTMADIHARSFARGWTLEDLSATLSVPGAAALVVELSGTIYGFVQFHWVAGEAEINTICVLPNYRRQHFGQDLMQGLLGHLQSMGTTRLFLEVAENNSDARGLYQSFGFDVSGQRKAYYADGQNAVTMVKDLTS